MVTRATRKPRIIDGFSKGMLVRKFQTWGNNRGKPDMANLYRIRTIGPNRAMLDRVDENGEPISWRRGQSHYKSSRDAFIDASRRNVNMTTFDYPYLWSHIFIPVSQDGWDGDF